jgi:hypothetical protein
VKAWELASLSPKDTASLSDLSDIAITPHAYTTIS